MATEITRHERTDEWKVIVDGKTYWATRFTADGKEAWWRIEVVRASPNGQNPFCRDVNEDGPVYKRVVKAVKEAIAND